MYFFLFLSPGRSYSRASRRPRAPRSRTIWGCFAVLLILALTAPATTAQEGASPRPRTATESTLKTVYLTKLPRFVEWPAAAGPLRICLLGDDPFGREIADAVAGETAKGYDLTLDRLTSLDGFESCQLLFLGHRDAGELRPILERLRGASILTVGDAANFARLGGMVGFVVQGGKLKIEINLEAVRAAGLKIRSQLLKLATIVEE